MLFPHLCQMRGAGRGLQGGPCWRSGAWQCGLSFWIFGYKHLLQSIRIGQASDGKHGKVPCPHHQPSSGHEPLLMLLASIPHCNITSQKLPETKEIRGELRFSTVPKQVCRQSFYTQAIIWVFRAGLGCLEQKPHREGDIWPECVHPCCPQESPARHWPSDTCSTHSVPP